MSGRTNENPATIKRFLSWCFWIFISYLFLGDNFWNFLLPLLAAWLAAICIGAIWLITVELYTKYASSIFSERYVIPVPFANRQATR